MWLTTCYCIRVLEADQCASATQLGWGGTTTQPSVAQHGGGQKHRRPRGCSGLWDWTSKYPVTGKQQGSCLRLDWRPRRLMMLIKPCLCLSGSSNRKCLYNHHAALVPERRAAQLTANNCALVCVFGTGRSSASSRPVDKVALRSSSGAFCHCGPPVYLRIEQTWPTSTFPSGDRRPNGARQR